jgi:hypothetical protein
MTFLRPAAWFLALLAVPLVLLYLRRRRPRCVSVAAGFLWQQVLAEGASDGRWLRWRTAASFAVELAVLLLIVAAMAEPAGGATWWRYLAAAALTVLTAQWYLFQRRWICW